MTMGFIGTGRIASAVISGLCTSTMENIRINISPRNEQISMTLSEAYTNVTRLKSNQLVLDRSDLIFISLPPKDAKEIISNLTFRENHIVISVIPYLLCEDLARIISPARQISRAIPLPTVLDHRCPIPIFQANETVTRIFGYIGEPLRVENEDQLHTLWVLTGLISPFYDLMNELSDWSQKKGVTRVVADRYIIDMYNALSFSAGRQEQIDFGKLTKHAATPNGMNEQAAKELNEKRVHQVYTAAADRLLDRFTDNL